MHRVGVVGASGFVGAELLRLLASHPELTLEVATADSHAGRPVAGLYPHLAGAYWDVVFEPLDPAAIADRDLDLVFLALPHGESQRIVPELRDRVKLMIDLAADFRLRDPALYPVWYGEAHGSPDLLAEAGYGLPELFRHDLAGRSLVAAPGCYPTAAAMALAPLVAAGLIEPSGIVVDAASGVSGAGRDKHPFCAVDEDFAAYGLLDHRHTPEIEQALGPGANVLFTPHLAPMNRGILATCYARPTDPGASTNDVLQALAAAYRNEPFVVVSPRAPTTKATLGSNSVHLTGRADPRTGWILSLCALDNLVKGAAGQAIQCANLLLGLPEATGLPTVGVYP